MNKDLILKFYEFYCRKPSLAEFADFAGEDAILKMKEEYPSYFSTDGSFDALIRHLFNDIPKAKCAYSSTRSYNVYKWDGEFVTYGDLETICEYFDGKIYDIASLNSIPIRRLTIIGKPHLRFLVTARKYNREEFLNFVDGKGGCDIAALKPSAVVELRNIYLTDGGREKQRVRKSPSQIYVPDELHDTIYIEYKNIIDAFVALYNRQPMNKELEHIGINRSVLNTCYIKSVDDLCMFYGMDVKPGDRTYMVFDEFGDEEFRGTRKDVSSKYKIAESSIRPNSKVYGKYIKIMHFNNATFNEFRKGMVA